MSEHPRVKVSSFLGGDQPDRCDTCDEPWPCKAMTADRDPAVDALAEAMMHVDVEWYEEPPTLTATAIIANLDGYTLVTTEQAEAGAAAVCPVCHGDGWYHGTGWREGPDGEPSPEEVQVPCDHADALGDKS